MQKAIQIGYDDLFPIKCQCASEAGFQQISLNFNPLMGKTEDEWKLATEDIQQILERHHLQCIQSHLCEYNLLISSEIPDADRDFAIRQSIIASGRLGAKYGAFHPRTSISSGYRPSKSFEDNRILLSGLLECAIQSGISIAVENLPIFPSRSKIMPFYSSDFEDLATLVDSFSDEHIVICWDFGHANLMKWDPAAAIECLGSRIQCTHIHNNYGFVDDHSTPDMGNIDWKSAMAALAATGYDGPLTLETQCRYIDFELFRSFAKHCFACLDYLERLTKKEG